MSTLASKQTHVRAYSYKLRYTQGARETDTQTERLSERVKKENERHLSTRTRSHTLIMDRRFTSHSLFPSLSFKRVCVRALFSLSLPFMSVSMLFRSTTHSHMQTRKAERLPVEIFTIEKYWYISVLFDSFLRSVYWMCQNVSIFFGILECYTAHDRLINDYRRSKLKCLHRIFSHSLFLRLFPSLFLSFNYTISCLSLTHSHPENFQPFYFNTEKKSEINWPFAAHNSMQLFYSFDFRRNKENRDLEESRERERKRNRHMQIL